jgi:hypothetical protein
MLPALPRQHSANVVLATVENVIITTAQSFPLRPCLRRSTQAKTSASDGAAQSLALQVMLTLYYTELHN